MKLFNMRGVLVGLGAIALSWGGASGACAADAYLRVVDVGNGLCVVLHTPDGHSMLYDAGATGSYCLNAVKEIIGEDKIDLVVLSHSDADHIGELPKILQAKGAGTLIYPGDAHVPPGKAIENEVAAIKAQRPKGTMVWSLKDEALSAAHPTHPRTYALGAGTATIVAGWSDGEETRDPGEKALPTAEHNNAISIVVRFEYGGHSVLLTGDTVGRFGGDPPNTCLMAERAMVRQTATWPIKSDVLIGQHHGGDNSSSTCFVNAVKPKYVVFSAGHVDSYKHPRASAARRFLLAGVTADNIFRTDLGDNQGDPEWVYGSIKGCHDRPGDDDVEMWLPSDAAKPIRADYRTPKTTC